MSRSKEKRRRRIVELVTRFTRPPAEILEISCGNGEILQRLRQDGYRVRGTNYSIYPDADASLSIDNGVDILKGLPHAEASFDVVILVDVIEHLRDHDAAIRELSRVTRPGGHVVMLTPNIMRIGSRLSFLLTGFFKPKRDFIGFDVPPEKSFAFHNYPVHLPTLLYLLHARGLETVAVEASGFKTKSWILSALLLPLILPATWLRTRLQEPNLRDSPAAALLFRSLLSRAGLCGESLIVVSRKVAAAAGPAARGTSLPEWSEVHNTSGTS